MATTGAGRSSRSGFRRGWSALVGVALTPVLSVGLVLGASPAYAWGSSITSPGAAASLGMTEAQYAAYLANGIDAAAMYANGAGAVAATAPITSAAAATGAGVTTTGGSVLGRILVGIGGLLGFKFLVPDAGDPGLPAGSGGWSGTVTGVNGSNVWSGNYGITKVSGTDPTATFAVTISGVTGVTGTSYGPRVAWYLTNVASGCVVGGNTPQLGSLTASGDTNTINVAMGGNLGAGCSYAAVTGVKVVPFRWNYDGFKPYNAGAVYVQLTGATGAVTRTIEQTVTCKTAAGTVSTVTNATTGAAWSAGDMVEVAGLMCPSGSRAVGVEAVVKTPGGADLKVIDVPAGGAIEEATDVPEPCYSGGTCTLRVQRLQTPSGTWADVAPDALSPDWWTDPNRDVKYRCVYGSSDVFDVVPIGQCSWYRDPSSSDPLPPADPVTDVTDAGTDCTFGWSDLLTGGVFIDGSKCVVRWAFTPTPGTLENLNAQVQARAPFSVAVEAANGAEAMVTAYSAAGSCGSIADFTTDDIDGLIACDAFSKIPGATALRALVGVVLVALTGLYAFNLAAARFSGGGA